LGSIPKAASDYGRRMSQLPPVPSFGVGGSKKVGPPPKKRHSHLGLPGISEITDEAKMVSKMKLGKSSSPDKKLRKRSSSKGKKADESGRSAWLKP